MTKAHTFKKGPLAKANGFFKLTLDALLPPQCLSCRSMVEDAGSLCPSCWDKIDFAAMPCCEVCGLTFEFDPGMEMLCGACAYQRPVYRRARSVMAYGEISRRMVIAFKHGDACEAAPAFGQWMARAGGSLIADADLAAPVPLHWTRLIARRYNQAALLTLAIGRLTGVAVAPDLLIRRRRTPSQGGLGPKERWRNQKGAFVARPSRINEIKGKTVLLVDDVMTTGATISACSQALLDAGALAVDALTLVKVMRPSY